MAWHGVELSMSVGGGEDGRVLARDTGVALTPGKHPDPAGIGEGSRKKYGQPEGDRIVVQIRTTLREANRQIHDLRASLP